MERETYHIRKETHIEVEILVVQPLHHGHIDVVL